jgi:hypothetical protein
MDGEELLRRYAAGERDFRGVIFQHINLDGIELEEADFTGAIFNNIGKSNSFDSIFVNCNFSCSEWWSCVTPKLVGCNLQYAVMKSCRFWSKFINCDWRFGQIKGAYWDDFVFEECDLREMRWSEEGRILVPEPYVDPNFGLLFRNTFDKDGAFHSGICCNVSYLRLQDDIPF